MKCTCKYCRDVDYDNSEFFVDRSFLRRERPVGVTGLLRVKNDAEFLALCIDSCIDALDELVIVYQPCTDESPRIIEEKRRQYPDKIRSYFYRPHVLSHNLSDEEFRYASSLPEESIHLLSNYYNYTLSKASFRYAMKIDADQIYFSDKLKRFCDAYRSDTEPRITFREYWTAKRLHLFSDLTNIFPGLLSERFRRLIPSERAVGRYENYVLKKIARKKYPVSFSGINLYRTGNRWVLPLGSYAEGLFPPFNGIHDTIVFEIGLGTYYVSLPIQSPMNKYKNCVIESFPLNKTFIVCKSLYRHTLLYGGFMWYHTAPMKGVASGKADPDYKGLWTKLSERPDGFFEIEKRMASPLRRWMRGWYCLFWNKERHELPVDYLNMMNFTHTNNLAPDEKQEP